MSGWQKNRAIVDSIRVNQGSFNGLRSLESNVTRDVCNRPGARYSPLVSEMIFQQMRNGEVVAGIARRGALGTLVLIHRDRDFCSKVTAVLSGEPDWQPVESFQSVEAALPLLETVRVEVLMIGMEEPYPSFTRSLDLLRKVQPDTPFLFVANGARPVSVVDAVRFGASGYLLTKDIPDRLRMSLSEMKKEGFPLSSCLAAGLIQELRPKTVTHPGFAKLTARERECLQLLSAGRLYKEIAADLGIGLETARTHIKRLFVKLEVNTRTEAAVRLFSGS